jgi:hypothetical protein
VTVHCSSQTIALVKLVPVGDPRLLTSLLLRTGHLLLGWTRLLDSRTHGCHTHIAVLLSCSTHKSGIVTGLLNKGDEMANSTQNKVMVIPTFEEHRLTILDYRTKQHEVKSPPIIVPPQNSRDL